MKFSRLVPVILCSLLMLSTPVQAAVVTLEDGLAVEYHPDQLTLQPGERGTVRLEVRNSGSEDQFVALTNLVLKSAGASGATIEPDFFKLAVGESKVVRVVIESYATRQDHGVSDCHILIEWGPNLTVVDGRVDESTVKGEATIILEVIDDFTTINAIIIGSIIMVVAVIISFIALFFLKGRDKPDGSI